MPYRPLTEYELLRARSFSCEAVFKFGANRAVGTTPEDIWNGGGLWDGFDSAATTVRIAAGGNANDTAAGTGARTVTVVGLVDGVEDPETLTTAGTSASASTTKQFTIVYRAFAATVGSAGFNVGDVTIESTDGTTTFAVFPAELGQTLLSFFRIPTGKVGALRALTVGVEGPASGTNVWMLRREGPGASSRAIVLYTQLVDSYIIEKFANPLLFPAGTDLWFRANTESGNAAVAASYELELYDE